MEHKKNRIKKRIICYNIQNFTVLVPIVRIVIGFDRFFRVDIFPPHFETFSGNGGIWTFASELFEYFVGLLAVFSVSEQAEFQIFADSMVYDSAFLDEIWTEERNSDIPAELADIRICGFRTQSHH